MSFRIIQGQGLLDAVETSLSLWIVILYVSWNALILVSHKSSYELLTGVKTGDATASKNSGWMMNVNFLFIICYLVFYCKFIFKMKRINRIKNKYSKLFKLTFPSLAQATEFQILTKDTKISSRKRFIKVVCRDERFYVEET